MSYCIDSSSLIRAAHEVYPNKVFPSLWQAMDAELGSKVLAPMAVFDECTKKQQWLNVWLKPRKSRFSKPAPGVTENYKAILAKHPKLVNQKKLSCSADPWVIAMALTHGLTVVSDEKPRTRGKKTIHQVCAALVVPVPSITVVEMLEALGWTF